MPFTKGHQLWKHKNCVASQFTTGSSVRVGMRHTETSKKKMSESRSGKTTGENNPSWKGGVTKLGIKIKRLPEYKEWQKYVLFRDNFTCRSCGKRGGLLTPHHLISFSWLVVNRGVINIKEAKCSMDLWDIDNGVTLCKACHENTVNYSYRARSNPVDYNRYEVITQ